MYANLEVNSYDVTINAESNGSVSSSSIKVNYGGTNTFTVTPNTGYYLESLSCTNGYTASGYTTGTSATGSQTVTISNNNNANDSSCSVSFKASCPYSIGHSWRFYYTEGVQEFKAECAGTYKLEVWGAQGGDDVGTGGLGGHAIGSIDLIKNQQLYIVVGGRGKTTTMTGYINSPTITAGKGGYNGGGDGNGSHHQDNYSYEYHYMLGAGGGGATHIATTNRGILENYDSYRSEVLLVAGGGGGALYDYEPRENNGDDKIITQDGGAGGSGGGFTFGKGMSGSSGGGGGWSGGTSGHVDSSTNTTSTGGTNYIGNVTDSDSEYGIRYGDGYARIYLVSLTN